MPDFVIWIDWIAYRKNRIHYIIIIIYCVYLLTI